MDKIRIEKNASGVDFQHWQESVQIISNSGPVVRQEGCFAIMFTNIGSAICRVNNMVVFPNTNPATGLGDSKSLGAHKNDLYTGSINVSFENTGVKSLELVQLCYSKSYK
jgi:hypothetical protein